MVYQEDVMLYFDEISSQLREENIPIFNNVTTTYPGFLSEEERIDDDDEETESDEN